MSTGRLFYLALLPTIVSMWLMFLSVSGSAGQSSQEGNVSYLNPEGLHRNPAYSQVVVVTGKTKTIYVGGQNAVDASGNIVGRGDIKAQTEQVFTNLKTALAAGGARLEHVIKWNVYIVQGQPIEPGFEVFRKEWGNRPNPPLITGVLVSGLANPDFLIEMDAVAVVPEEQVVGSQTVAEHPLRGDGIG